MTQRCSSFGFSGWIVLKTRTKAGMGESYSRGGPKRGSLALDRS